MTRSGTSQAGFFTLGAQAYRNYLLVILAVFLGLSVVDRLALGLLLQNIKQSLHLSDTQLGVLTGLAFAVFYAFAGLFIGRWADRGNRITIIATTAALWSVLVGLCGVAQSFGELLVMRVGVAVGECGCVPTANSLIADYFERADRPRAIAIFFTIGASISALVGYLVAGWINEFYGWRTTFVVIALPGMILAALAWLTLRDPRNGTAAAVGVPPPALCPDGHVEDGSVELEDPSIMSILLVLLKNVTFRNLLLSFSITSFFTSGIAQWQPAFFVRSFGFKTGDLGTWFAVIYGVGGAFGTYLGGELASRYAANNEPLQLRVAGIVLSIFAVISTLIYLSSNASVALVLMALACLGAAILLGPALAAIVTVVPARSRAVAIATLYLFGNLIGLGLGPLVVGVMSDAFRPLAGINSLRYALVAMSPGYLWGAWHMWRASATVSQDLRRVLSNEEEGAHKQCVV